MLSEAKWHFVSNNNATITGINDAGIETFSGNLVYSLVREVLQNSLDAQEDKSKPVTVEFHQFSTKKEDLPEVTYFEGVLNKCLLSVSDEDAQEFFKQAITVLNGDIPVLRISDFNTSGLLGADTAQIGSPWSRLVKEVGSSNKDKTSGGSFGIGKSAPFACSDLRTVFYSSKDKEGINSNIGVAKLVSFKNENGDLTLGTGYYSDSEKLTAVLEIAKFDSEFTREVPGTDLYIFGFMSSTTGIWEDGSILKEDFIITVLENFLISIWNDNLVVKIQDDIISKDTLDYWVNWISAIKRRNKELMRNIANIGNYYYILSSKDERIKKVTLNCEEYGKEFGFTDGECTLYLMKGENLNRRILMTRRTGMKIREQDHLPQSIDFTGIMMMEGLTMNEVFRAMEKPSHDDWEPERYKKDPMWADEVYAKLRRYIRDTILKLLGEIVDEEVDAFGVGDYLPDKLATQSGNGEITEKLITKVKKIEEKKLKPVKKISRSLPKEDVSPTGEVEFPGSKPKKTKSKNPHPIPLPDETSDKIGDEEGDEKGFLKRTLKSRIFCLNRSEGLYVVKFTVPKKVKRSRLEFDIIGEQTAFAVDIKSALVVTGDAVVEKFRKNFVYLTNNRRNDEISLHVKLNTNQYSMMEVTYYEN